MTSILVTGGTGSIGHEVVRQALIKGWEPIVLSRDEGLQAEMRQQYPQCEFIIGDVTWQADLEMAKWTYNPDYVVHTAALKHVTICEQQPLKAVQTNVVGTMNVLQAFAGIAKNIVIVSTDKTVEPVCIMGYTKKLCEAIVRDPTYGDKRVCVVRFGNILPSRGSVVPLWLDAKRQGLPLKITDPEMTRFFVPVQDAAQTIFAALEHGKSGDIWVPMLSRVRLGDLLEVIADGSPTEVIGARPGEKKDERIFSPEEEKQAKLVKTQEHYYYLLRKGEEGDGLEMTNGFRSKEGIVAMLNRAMGDTWR